MRAGAMNMNLFMFFAATCRFRSAPRFAYT